MSVTVRVDGVQDMQQALRKLARGLNKQKQREIAVAGSDVAAPIVARAVPVRSKGEARPYYSKGKKVATFLPGNLRGSTIELGKRRKRIRDVGLAIIGPIRKQKAATPSGEYGRRKFDGYYAQMVYGSARAYQQRVVVNGRRAAAPAAFGAMIRKAKEITGRLINSVGL